MASRGATLLALLLAAVLKAEARLVVDSAYSNAYWNSHGLGIVQNATNLAGTVVTFGSGNASIEAYVVKPPGLSLPTAAVIIFTDIYGWALPNTRLWADRLAKAGFLVVLPDYFRGDALTEATRSTMPEWRKRHTREQVLADFQTVLAGVKAAYPSVKKIGAQGFCWGGLYAVILSTANAPKVDAAVAFHPASLTTADFEAVAGPLSIHAADPKLDNNLNTTAYPVAEQIFKAKRAKGIPVYLTNYPNMPHGFALRGNMSDPAWRAASNTAFDEGAKFLQAQLLAPPKAARSMSPAGFLSRIFGRRR